MRRRPCAAGVRRSWPPACCSFVVASEVLLLLTALTITLSVGWHGVRGPSGPGMQLFQPARDRWSGIHECIAEAPAVSNISHIGAAVHSSTARRAPAAAAVQLAGCGAPGDQFESLVSRLRQERGLVYEAPRIFFYSEDESGDWEDARVLGVDLELCEQVCARARGAL
jgi:hypothetical protein